MRYMRRLLTSPTPRPPLLPRGGSEPPGLRLAALRAAAAETGWGPGVAATAALTGAVTIEEKARIAVVTAPLVTVALALAGYEVVAYGDSPPCRAHAVVPLTWGTGAIAPPPRRFDAVAVDATAHPVAAPWLGQVLADIARRGRRTRLAILCRAADAQAYTTCFPRAWAMTSPYVSPDAPPVILVASE